MWQTKQTLQNVSKRYKLHKYLKSQQERPHWTFQYLNCRNNTKTVVWVQCWRKKGCQTIENIYSYLLKTVLFILINRLLLNSADAFLFYFIFWHCDVTFVCIVISFVTSLLGGEKISSTCRRGRSERGTMLQIYNSFSVRVNAVFTW